jgi:hypothetical protein
LIATFPSLKYDIDDYPTVKCFLEGFLPKLQQTGKKLTSEEKIKVMTHALKHGINITENSLKASRKKTTNKWFETQDSISYWEDFYKQKVIWKIIGSNINFCFDNEKYFCNNAVNIMTGAPTLLLQFIGLMNSSLFNWYLKLTTEAEVQGEGIQLYATTIENTPVKLDFDEEFSNLVYQRQRKKIPDCILDEYIYKLYNLTHEEITFIKNSF